MVDSRSIPNFVKARSPRGLRLAMLRVNTQRRAFHKFFDIQFHPTEKYWYAWFYADVSSEDIDAMSGGDDG